MSQSSVNIVNGPILSRLNIEPLKDRKMSLLRALFGMQASFATSQIRPKMEELEPLLFFLAASNPFLKSYQACKVEKKGESQP